jgi:hypothetical protein
MALSVREILNHLENDIRKSTGEALPLTSLVPHGTISSKILREIFPISNSVATKVADEGLVSPSPDMLVHAGTLKPAKKIEKIQKAFPGVALDPAIIKLVGGSASSGETSLAAS